MKRIVLLLLVAVISVSAFAQSSPSPQAMDSDMKSITLEPQEKYIRLKTNGIGWLMLVTNVAAEFDMSRRFSFALPIYYSGFNYFKSTLKFRTFTVQPEVRYWFSDCHQGWFIGAHMGMGYFNYALGKGHYRIQDMDKRHPAWGGGLAFGYRMPLTDNRRWEMEFTLGAGVYDAHYDKWENRPHGERVQRGIHTTFFGIDQAAVSIVYRFQKNGK